MNSILRYFIVLFFPIFAAAQPIKISEKEVIMQGAFIDGAMMQSLQQYEKAETVYQGVLQKDAKNAAANYELARVYGALKKDEKAIQNCIFL